MIRVTDRIWIDEAEIEESFIRSTGPGGQNVNKVATAVQIRFDVRNSSSLPAAVKDRLERLAGSRMTLDGVLVMTARAHRSQDRNREEARSRLVEMVREAALPPRPRVATRIPYGERRRRREDKARKSVTKTLRGGSIDQS
jgi:ribosome-associated protein